MISRPCSSCFVFWTVIDKIQGLVEKDQRERQQLDRVPHLKIEHLQAGENELNRLCYAHSVALLGRLEKVAVAFDKVHSDHEQRTSDIRAGNEGLNAAKEAALDKATVSKKLEAVTTAIASYEPEVQRTKEAIKETEALLAIHKKQSELFQKHLVDVNVRCDMSREVTRLGKKCFNAKLNVDVESDGCTDRVVLTMEYELKDDFEATSTRRTPWSRNRSSTLDRLIWKVSCTITSPIETSVEPKLTNATAFSALRLHARLLQNIHLFSEKVDRDGSLERLLPSLRQRPPQCRR